MLRRLHENYAVEHGNCVRAQNLPWDAGKQLFMLLDFADDRPFRMCDEFCPTLNADVYERYVKSCSCLIEKTFRLTRGLKTNFGSKNSLFKLNVYFSIYSENIRALLILSTDVFPSSMCNKELQHLITILD